MKRRFSLPKNFILLLSLELIVLFVLVVLGMRSSHCLYALTTADFAEYSSEESSTVYRTAPLSLPIGVYHVTISGTFEDGTMVSELIDPSGAYGHLRTSATPLFAGEDEALEEIYVLFPVSATIELTCQTISIDALDSISVIQTPLLYRMLAVLWGILCLALNLWLVLVHRIRSGMLPKHSVVVVLLLGLSVLIAFLPFWTDYYNFGADAPFHYGRIEGLFDSIKNGNFPVRIQSYWLYDHGYAVSSFYCDLFLLFPVLLRLSGFSLMTSYKMFVLAVLILSAVIGYHSFRAMFQNTGAALCSSVLYLLAPYHLYNIYNRGAVGEYLAMAFFPIVLAGFVLLLREDPNIPSYRSYKYLLIFGMCGLLCSHILSTEIALIYLLIAAIIHFRQTFRKQTILQILEAIGISVALTAWFWIPLLTMYRNDTYVLQTEIAHNIQAYGTQFAELFQLTPYMGSAQTGMYYAEPFHIGIVLLFFVVISSFYGIAHHNAHMRRYAILTILTLWMSSTLFPWDVLCRIPYLGTVFSSMQFATRLLAPACLFSATATGYCVIAHQRVYQNASPGSITRHALTCGYSALLLIAVLSASFHMEDTVYSISPIRVHSAQNIGTMAIVRGEYLLAGSDYHQLSYRFPAPDPVLTLTDYEKHGTTIIVTVSNSADSSRLLQLPLIGYYGYEVSDGTDHAPVISKTRAENGDLLVEIPAGYEGTITVSYPESPLYLVGDFVSLGMLLTLLVLFLIRKKNSYEPLANKNAETHSL